MTRPEPPAAATPSSAGGVIADDVIRHAGEVLGFLTHHVGDRATAADLLQDVLVRALRGLEEVRGRENVRPWLFRIAVRRFHDWVRRDRPRRHESPTGEPVDHSPASSPAASAEIRETESLLRDAVAELPERQRTVMLLHGVDGLGPSAIAEVLGISVGAVKTALYHARETLRERLRSRLGRSDETTGERR
jgi:RNA polymerase sigma-70 factor (ECF subfamily)